MRACVVVVDLLVLPVVVAVAVVPCRAAESVCRPITRVRCVNEKRRRGRAARYPKIADASVDVGIVVAVAVVAAAVAVVAVAVAPTYDSTSTSKARGVVGYSS